MTLRNTNSSSPSSPLSLFQIDAGTQKRSHNQHDAHGIPFFLSFFLHFQAESPKWKKRLSLLPPPLQLEEIPELALKEFDLQFPSFFQEGTERVH